MVKLLLGDCIDKMKELEDNSIDSIVTDPPYGLKFMGKKWDYNVPSVDVWKEVFRVLKPGGHILSFGGTRTYHRMVCGIEDAGFEIMPMCGWLYGQGFPKSLNVGKAVDKIQGNKREVIETKATVPDIRSGNYENSHGKERLNANISKGNSEWEGFGTSLKPAMEPICMARKPIEKGLTIAGNCLKWGTGGINIDGCRIPTDEDCGREQKEGPCPPKYGFNNNSMGNKYQPGNPQGRFPANLIHDGSDEVLEIFSNTKSIKGKKRIAEISNQTPLLNSKQVQVNCEYDESGSAARFFYCAKPSKKERNMGCESLSLKEAHFGKNMSSSDKGTISNSKLPNQNNHPTIKPLTLMKYLVKLITPLNGTCLDPFMGSCTTGMACNQLNIDFIGIEIDEGYFEIANHRIKSTESLF